MSVYLIFVSKLVKKKTRKSSLYQKRVKLSTSPFPAIKSAAEEIKMDSLH